MSLAMARRHAMLRWTGVPLVVIGAGLLVFSLIQAARGDALWTTIPHALLGLGLGLAAFGANHDTALALAWEIRSNSSAGAETPGGPLQDELDRELEADRTAVMALRASPRVALLMPFIALLVQVWLLWRLLG
ncbi:MAG: hypothetical protein GXP62_05255 [Oligoflexia bacterium]|nr:hypothetical protein [Oligoflexia bacterium]